MSQDVDQIADSHSPEPVRSSDPVDYSTRYDDLIIDDRPSLYSVSEPESIYPQSSHYPADYSPADPNSMIDKLKAEIAHLEKWLSVQLESRPKSLSIANTIRNLIATRKSLLNNLLKK